MSDYGSLSLFIDGVWIGAEARDGGEVVNPATGDAIAKLPHATPADLDAAAEAAARAFPAWKALPAFDRSAILRRAADLLRERAGLIATRMVMEQGKPLMEAKIEVLSAADIFDWAAEEGRRLYGRIVPSRITGVRWSVLREAVGPVAAFTPWNIPTVIPARKISAALACGCTMVIKPAEETPASTLEIARALDDAGLPKGVLNVVFGQPADVSRHLIAHPAIRKITFTGSTGVGMLLAEQAAQAGCKRTTMELGGHAPVMVFEDADIDAAVATIAPFKFRNAGQVCISPTRFYVHESVHDRFVAGLTAFAQSRVLGDGTDPATTMGPLANPRRITAMETLVEDAIAQGATLTTGGKRLNRKGNFFQPTVLADAPVTARIMNEEPFGPVAVTARFSTLDEVITQANRLPYGLASYAFTTSTATAEALAMRVEAGMLGINNAAILMTETPFGGVKQSGYGAEGGVEGMEPYLVTKLVSQS